MTKKRIYIYSVIPFAFGLFISIFLIGYDKRIQDAFLLTCGVHSYNDFNRPDLHSIIGIVCVIYMIFGAILGFLFGFIYSKKLKLELEFHGTESSKETIKSN